MKEFGYDHYEKIKLEDISFGKIIDKISKELGFPVFDAEIHPWDSSNYLNNSLIERPVKYTKIYHPDGRIEKKEIFEQSTVKIGLFENPRLKLISFFHEIGHFIIKRDGWMKKLPVIHNNETLDQFILYDNILMDEFMASVIGLQYAEEKGFLFSKEEQLWLFERFCGYSKENTFWKCSPE